MSQSDFGTIDPTTKSGTQLALDLNDSRDAEQSNHKGSSEPSYKKTGLIWLDDSANPIWTLKMWDGTDWIQLMVIDVANNLCTADTDQIFSTLGPALAVTTAGTGNTYTASVTPAPSGYVTNAIVLVNWDRTNTGAATLNLNALGAKSIKTPNGSNVVAGDLLINTTGLLIYNGTNFMLLSNVFLAGGVGAETNIASASTTNLGTATTHNVSVTGTTTITSFGSTTSDALRPFYHVRFTGALTLTHNATSLILPGGANIKTAAGDSCLADYLGSGNWRVRHYLKANGQVISMTGTETSLASASTTDLGANSTLSNSVLISGTTTITSFGSSASLANPVYFLRFSGALTLTHDGTALILPGGANITTAAGDTAIALYLGSGNWRVIQYTIAANAPGGSVGTNTHVITTASIVSSSPNVWQSTGLSVTVTPKSTNSKFNLRALLCMGGAGGGLGGLRFLRNGTPLTVGTSVGSKTATNAAGQLPGGTSILNLNGEEWDSPNTVSSVTYTVEFIGNVTDLSLNQVYSESNTPDYYRPTSRLTVIEYP